MHSRHAADHVNSRNGQTRTDREARAFPHVAPRRRICCRAGRIYESNEKPDKPEILTLPRSVGRASSLRPESR